VARDEDASAVQRLQQGSTGGAANVYKLSEAAGVQQAFTIDGVTDSVNEFNGVLSVSAPVFSSGALSGAVTYISSHHQISRAGSITPQHQGVAGRWNSNFFGRFVDHEARMEFVGPVGAQMTNVYPVEAYYVETPGGGRLSQLVQHWGKQPPAYASPRLPGLETNPNQAILEDGSAVESTTAGFVVSWRNGGRTLFTHRVGSAWNFGAEGVYATRSIIPDCPQRCEPRTYSTVPPSAVVSSSAIQQLTQSGIVVHISYDESWWKPSGFPPGGFHRILS